MKKNILAVAAISIALTMSAAPAFADTPKYVPAEGSHGPIFSCDNPKARVGKQCYTLKNGGYVIVTKKASSTTKKH